jgi:hypothetical protein
MVCLWGRYKCEINYLNMANLSRKRRDDPYYLAHTLHVYTACQKTFRLSRIYKNSSKTQRTEVRR